VSQIILDDQLADVRILTPLTRWTTVQRLRDLRPQEVIKDERVPAILRELRQPTFVTLDMGFWNPRLRDGRYCILCFPLRTDEESAIPGLLRRLLRFPEFATKAARMGKVARVSQAQVDYWRIGNDQLQRLASQEQWKSHLLRELAPAYEMTTQPDTMKVAPVLDGSLLWQETTSNPL
jgi:hypothetical protein